MRAAVLVVVGFVSAWVSPVAAAHPCDADLAVFQAGPCVREGVVEAGDAAGDAVNASRAWSERRFARADDGVPAPAAPAFAYANGTHANASRHAEGHARDGGRAVAGEWDWAATEVLLPGVALADLLADDAVETALGAYGLVKRTYCDGFMPLCNCGPIGSPICLP